MIALFSDLLQNSLLPEIIFILYQNFTFSNASIVLEKRDSIHEMFFFSQFDFFYDRQNKTTLSYLLTSKLYNI